MGVHGVRVLQRREGSWAVSEFLAPTRYNYNPAALAVGDLNTDGCPDVVVTNGNVGTSVYLGSCP
jgi:hypothetical protein